MAHGMSGRWLSLQGLFSIRKTKAPPALTDTVFIYRREPRQRHHASTRWERGPPGKGPKLRTCGRGKTSLEKKQEHPCNVPLPGAM